MIEVLFFIPDLRGGGAEKVLVDLLNNFSSDKYKITLLTLFDIGVNKKNLNNSVNYKSIFKIRLRGYWRLIKLFPAKLLHKILIGTNYDIEIAYLEGTATKIISGGSKKIKKVAWIHCELTGKEKYFLEVYKSKKDFYNTYNKFDMLVGVSDEVLSSFETILPKTLKKKVILNTVDSKEIIKKSDEKSGFIPDKNYINFISVGRLVEQKGYLRLLKIFYELKDFKNVRLYILGEGNQKQLLEKFIKKNKMDNVRLIGYQQNPYAIEKMMDCFICSSYQEGFSTAATEALILGIPIITTNCSGSKFLCKNGAGLLCENSSDSLKKAILKYITDSQFRNQLKLKAKSEGIYFSTERTVFEVEKLLGEL